MLDRLRYIKGMSFLYKSRLGQPPTIDLLWTLAQLARAVHVLLTGS